MEKLWCFKYEQQLLFMKTLELTGDQGDTYGMKIFLGYKHEVLKETDGVCLLRAELAYHEFDDVSSKQRSN